ncbi:type IV pilus assembly protein PilM [Agromyces seonyuensis]|uniref:Type IV pilus assembly protein PilM n=1 Tax=Agromyces seonyuensis TaxID=2662446 RepID=A0A6I4NZ19_9MICO|nr:type IV pilus assembly protein PilM [Agromyces seonyuensis]MWB99593.1 type IV pilus assembly protein PilM [Agromyces seonyuensis]
MARSIAGIDIGNGSIRAAEIVRRNRSKPLLVRYSEVPLPEGAVSRGEVKEPNTVAAALKTLWQQGGFKTKDVVLGIGNHRVISRDFSLRKLPADQLRDVLAFEARDVLPIAVVDAVLDFYPIAEYQGDQGPMLSGLLIAAEKDMVLGNVRSVERAGLNALDVDLVPFALSRALLGAEAPGTAAVVDVGAESITVVVVRDGIPQFVRIVPTGGKDVTTAVLDGLDTDPTAAEASKRDLGLSAAAGLGEDARRAAGFIEQVVGDQLTSIRNTISYYSGGHPGAPATRILLTGGAAQLRGFPEALAGLTGLPVLQVDPLTRVDVARSVDRARLADGERHLAVAVGLAIGAAA